MNIAEMGAVCQLVEGRSAAFEREEEAALPQPLLARCVVHVSVPLERSDQARLRITAMPPQQAQSLALEIPLVRDHEKGFVFSWFECSLALLPGIPLRFTVHDPGLAEPGLDVVMELANGHIQLHNNGRPEAFIGDLEKNVLDEYFWYGSLGYRYLQAPWVLRLGAYLVQHHDSGNMYQTVRYLPDTQKYEYHLHFVSAAGTPQDYVCLHDDLHDIEWEHALDLERFDLGFSVDKGSQRNGEKPEE